jgi:hypothetical protein
MLIDIDECCIGTSCDEQSTCANSFGNFTCTCSNGYSGNGTFCEGIIINIHLQKSYCIITGIPR